MNFLEAVPLANTNQARKRARQAEKHRQLNASQRSSLRSHIKKVITALEAKNAAEATVAFKAAVPVIDRMAAKGIIHKNKAARHKSRLNSRLKSLNLQAQ